LLKRAGRRAEHGILWWAWGQPHPAAL